MFCERNKRKITNIQEKCLLLKLSETLDDIKNSLKHIINGKVIVITSFKISTTINTTTNTTNTDITATSNSSSSSSDAGDDQDVCGSGSSR